MKGKTGPVIFGVHEPESGLKKALKVGRHRTVEEVRESKLKGRGGAGFPTGIKWNLAAAASGEKKYVICNADEGEPGTFKDRVLLSDYADMVFEGMTIGAFAIGASEGIVYLRGEYTYLLRHLECVLEKRRKEGFLGSGIMGIDGFDFDIGIRLGSGAYVCGEETALIESLEGKRGEPRNKPPFPVNVGFRGMPTIVNNVETFATVSVLLEKGVEWFKKFGTEGSTGTKLFSVSGDVEKPGVYEFPMGITISELLREVGKEDAKAVQVGGASGRCVPREEFSSTLAYEDIPTGGSIIVFGADRDMLSVAENFLEFFCEESCGQCVPCRLGNVKLLEGVRLLKEGKCSIAYLEELIELGRTMQCTCKCGLGQSSPNAFLSIVNYFRDEILGRVVAKQI